MPTVYNVLVNSGLWVIGGTVGHSRRRREYSSLTALLVAALILSTACSRDKAKPAEQKSTEELLEDLSNENNDPLRLAAVRRFGAIQGPVAIQALTVALKDSSGRVQLAAAEALGELKDPHAADVLWKCTGEPTYSLTLRFACARTMAKLGDARAVEPLVRALPRSRADATAALVKLGPKAVPALIEALHAAPTRPYASAVLVSIKDAAIDPLIEAVRNDPSKYARLSAAATLAEIEDERVKGTLDGLLKAGRPEETAAVYRFLIHTGRPGSEPGLLQALDTYGTREMAEDFNSSGNPVLQKAGAEWASKRNDLMATRSSELPPVYWAGIDPNVKRLALFHFDDSLSSTTGSAPLQSSGVAFVQGKWGSALSVGKGGILKYAVNGNLDMRDGTIEMWVSPEVDGADPVYTKYNHALVWYQSASSEQFLVSEATFAGFYGGTVVQKKFAGAGGGNIKDWKTGTWHHVAFTYSAKAARQRFYIDGTQIAETNAAMPLPGRDGPAFWVACDPYGNLTAFRIDELTIFSLRARSRRRPSRCVTRTQPASK